MIGISTKIFDLDGNDIFVDKDIASFSNDTTRRVTSTPTLDGSSFVSDGGYTDTDKIISFKLLNLSKERVDNLIRIAKYHSRIYVCSNEGAFEGVFKKIGYLSGVVSILITVVEGA